MFGLSEYTYAALYFYVLHATNGFIPKSRKEHYVKKGKVLREKLINKLGTNGVLFYPTFPQSAFRHGESTTKLSGVMYTAFFNIMGFPSTHVPVNHINFPFMILMKINFNIFFYCRIHIEKWQMGMDESGLPIGFQVLELNFFCCAQQIFIILPLLHIQ